MTVSPITLTRYLAAILCPRWHCLYVSVLTKYIQLCYPIEGFTIFYLKVTILWWYRNDVRKRCRLASDHFHRCRLWFPKIKHSVCFLRPVAGQSGTWYFLTLVALPSFRRGKFVCRNMLTICFPQALDLVPLHCWWILKSPKNNLVPGAGPRTIKSRHGQELDLEDIKSKLSDTYAPCSCEGVLSFTAVCTSVDVPTTCPLCLLYEW